jgi:hypothetical protein
MFQSLCLRNDSHVGFSLLSMFFDLVIAIASRIVGMREGPAPARSSHHSRDHSAAGGKILLLLGCVSPAKLDHTL